jgi:hypothetical protein
MKRSKPETALLPTGDNPEQPWADVLEAIAYMRDALERIGYRHASKELARQALKRFENSMKPRS